MAQAGTILLINLTRGPQSFELVHATVCGPDACGCRSQVVGTVELDGRGPAATGQRSLRASKILVARTVHLTARDTPGARANVPATARALETVRTAERRGLLRIEDVPEPPAAAVAPPIDSGAAAPSPPADAPASPTPSPPVVKE